MAQYQDGATVEALNFQPGIKRDGTSFDGNFASDGQWVRWRLGRPKKMGGYREIEDGFFGPVRAILPYGIPGLVRTFLFSSRGVQYLDLDYNCNGSAPSHPILPGFGIEPQFTWQADTLFDATGGGSALIVAHGSNYLNDIADSTDFPFYYANVLVPGAWSLGSVAVSGGLVVLQPFLFLYGNNGLIKNAARNSVTDFTTGDFNEVNVSGTKIVKGLPIRGGGQSPAGVFWSLQEVIRVNFVGGTAKFSYDTVTAASSILSPNGVVEYDGVFYWAGIDRFLSYTGIVKEVPNQLNQDFFFNNLNIAQRCKIWATKVPRWGEIWWFFCRDQATEPNWAVVYNVRENTWYDTPIERSAGYYSQILRFPLWADSVTNEPTATPPTYQLWQQEIGTDKVTDTEALAIDSYFVTPDLGFVNGDPVGGQSTPGMNNWTRTVRVEPNFVQSETMTVSFLTKKYASSPPQIVETKSFDPSSEFVDVRVQGRLNNLLFRSNVGNGNYHMGRVLLTQELGDPRAG